MMSSVQHRGSQKKERDIGAIEQVHGTGCLWYKEGIEAMQFLLSFYKVNSENQARRERGGRRRGMGWRGARPAGCGGGGAQSRSAGGRGAGRRGAEPPGAALAEPRPAPTEPLAAAPGSWQNTARHIPRRCSQQPAKPDGELHGIASTWQGEKNPKQHQWQENNIFKEINPLLENRAVQCPATGSWSCREFTDGNFPEQGGETALPGGELGSPARRKRTVLRGGRLRLLPHCLGQGHRLQVPSCPAPSRPLPSRPVPLPRRSPPTAGSARAAGAASGASLPNVRWWPG